MGPVKFLIFYLLAGVAALALQIVIDPSSQVPTLGASGAIAGVLGGYLLLFPRARVVTVIFIVFFFTILELPALLVLGFWFLQQALFGYFDLAQPSGQGGGVAYFAHIGGFVFGLLDPRSQRSACGLLEPQARRRADRATWTLSRREAAAPHRRCWSRCSRSAAGWRRSCATSPRRTAGAARRRGAAGAAAGLGHGAAGRRRHRAVAARGPARPRGRPRQRALQEAAALRRCCSTSTPAACCGAASRREVLPIASLTKMMTALVVVDRSSPGRRSGSPTRRCATRARASACCRAGKWIGVNTMLYGLLLPSGNDAAIALAQRAAGGSVRRFVRYMNEKAERSACVCTHFSTPERVRGQGQPLVRRRPRGDRPRRAARAAAGADRRAGARRSCRSRSRAAGCTSTTTTRCCARATAARRGSRPATPTPRGAAWWRPRGAGRSSSASSCSTRPTRASRRCSCSTAASAPQAPVSG